MTGGNVLAGLLKGSLVTAVLIGLAGASCEIDLDGDDGDRGPAGPPGPVSRDEATALDLEITDVRIGSPPVVEFSASDQDGVPFAGIPAGALEFTIAKLVPGSDGDPSHWQSYINREEDAGPPGPGTDPAIQATTDSGGTLEDHGNGTYTYTFGTDITNVTSPMPVTYEPNLTHRVGLAIRSEDLPPADNVLYTFQPSTGATSGIATRDIVMAESCNECHRGLEAHGGPRKDPRFCVTCHNPGTTDANSGHTVNFNVMIHKIHRGENLPSVEDGDDYVIYGFGDRPHNFSHVAFPQDVRNCTKCHDPGDAATPQAVNYKSNPNIAACGSCHDDTDFQGDDGDASNDHGGGVPVSNDECALCHEPESRLIAGHQVGIVAAHRIPEQEAAKRFQYNILEVTNTAPGEMPEITFSITDPTNGDAPYDIFSDPEFTGSAASVNLDIAWPTTDYTNFDPDAGSVTGSAPARPVSVDMLDPGNVTDNGDGTYTLAATIAVPASLEGSGAVAMEGHPAGDFDGDGTYDDEVPVTGAVAFFAITDATPQPRREVVDVAKCQACHGQNDGLSLHGGNRTDNVQLCVVCHNPNNTDLTMRPQDPDSAEDKDNADAEDGLEERAIDFKRMIHAIHGASKRTGEYWVYGFSNTPHDFSDVGFPASPADCNACHVDGSHRVPLASNVLATTVDTQATVASSSRFGTSDFTPDDGSASEPIDDGNITATAAVCSACHNTREAEQHMILNGAGFSTESPGEVNSGFDVTQAMVESGTVIETCAVCHGAGRTADVDVVHGLTPE